MAWLLFTMFIIDNMCHVMIGVGVVHTIGFEINFFCFDCVRFLDQCNNYEDGIFNSECILKNWAIPGLFFLYFRLFNTVDSKQMFDKSFANDWIRTADLWCRRRPLYQLSNNQCLNISTFYIELFTDNVGGKAVAFSKHNLVQCDQIWRFIGLWATF